MLERSPGFVIREPVIFPNSFNTPPLKNIKNQWLQLFSRHSWIFPRSLGAQDIFFVFGFPAHFVHSENENVYQLANDGPPVTSNALRGSIYVRTEVPALSDFDPFPATVILIQDSLYDCIIYCSVNEFNKYLTNEMHSKLPTHHLKKWCLEITTEADTPHSCSTDSKMQQGNSRVLKEICVLR